MLLLGLYGPLHHLASAARVKREHANRKPAAGLDGFGHGVRDIVELEIEKHIETEAGDFTHAVRSARGEHLQSHFHPVNRALELAENWRHLARGLGIKDKNQVAGHLRDSVDPS